MSGRDTVGQRQQALITELRAALTTAREGERRQMVLHQQQMLRADRAIEAARRADERVDNAGVERDEAVARQVQAEISRDAAIRERNRLLAELAKVPVVPPAPTEAAPTGDRRDATVIRFSLLELD